TVRSATGSIPGSGNVSGDEDVEMSDIRRVKLRGDGHRAVKRRVKPKIRQSEAPGETERASGSNVITQQLAPRTMELPTLSKGSQDKIGTYGSGWIEPTGF
ncbi:hypothetical protein FRC17_007870, partial [Serendipita sp. 399]